MTENKTKPKYGFASPNYDPEAKKKAQSKGGKKSKGGGRPPIKLEYNK